MRILIALLYTLQLCGPVVAQAAVVVRPGVGVRSAGTVPAVAPGALGALNPTGTNSPAGLASKTTLSGALPNAAIPTASPAVPLSARSAASPVNEQAVRETTSRSPRKDLRTAAGALAGERKAAQKRPGLAHLGARIAAPSKDAGLGAQHAQAERFFRQKAGFSHSETTGEDFLFHAFSPESADPRKQPSALADDSDPIYPSRRIGFNGVSLPSVAFRPDRSVETEIIKAIDATKNTLDIALYEFKNREILKALRRAKTRGVKVRVIIDAGHANPTKREGNDYWPHRSLELQAMINEGFEVRVLRGQWKWGIMHNKVAIFDGKLGKFGSYNWSYTSERNHFENAVFTALSSHVQGLQSLWDYLNKNSVSFEESLRHPWPEEVPAPPKDPSRTVRFNGLKLPQWVFTPDPAAEDYIIAVLDKAKTSIDMSMFTFGSPRISSALAGAKKRGVKVRVLVDEGQSKQPFMAPFVQWLASQGVPTKTIAGPNEEGPQWAEKNHNKFTIVDEKLVLTGSLNYTKSGFNTGFENMFFLDNKADAKSFAMFFGDMYDSRRAARVVPPGETPTIPTEEEIIAGLRGQPEAPPAPPSWPEMPPAQSAKFNGENFPTSVIRPHHPVKDLLVKAIDSSKKSIHLALYEFTLNDVLEALRRAKKRGVAVEVIIDFQHMFPKGIDSKGDERTQSPEIQALVEEGFDVTVLRGVKAQGIMHNKLGIFDKKMVSFGSYNWATTAENNHFESVKFETEKARVAYYVKLWSWMRSYAVAPKDAEDHKWNKAWKDGRQEGRTTPVDEDQAIKLHGERFPRTVSSPEGLAAETVIRAIRAAKTSIDIAMFSFYSAGIAEELLLAKKRGVHVRIALDRMQSKLMKLDDWFAYYGFDIKIVPGPNPYGNVYYEKNHNKFMIIDGKMLEMGSYNFTGNAEENSFENLNFYDDPIELAFYAAYFQMLYNLGWAPLVPEAPPEGLPTPAEFFSSQRMSNLQDTQDTQDFEL